MLNCEFVEIGENKNSFCWIKMREGVKEQFCFHIVIE